MGKTLVMKFGGTSMGDADSIRQSAMIVRNAKDQWSRIAVVVSAMSGVTDMLLEGAYAAADNRISDYTEFADKIQQKHLRAADELLETLHEKTYVQKTVNEIIGEFLTFCNAIQILNELSPRGLDLISSLGETMSVLLLSAHLRETDCKSEAVLSKDLIRTDSVYQSAYPDLEVTRELCRVGLEPLLQERIIPVITGFIGSTKEGVITTLGRGGSDFSAAIIGTALNADEVWIWTDVNGIMTTDPRLAPEAFTLETVTYREISELSYFGAKVLHPKTIRPVIESGIALWVKNTFNPQGPATQVVDNDLKPEGSIRAVTAIKNQSMVTIEGRGMIGVQGIAGRAFNAVARTHTSVSLISQASSEQSICFTIPSQASAEVLESLKNEFQYELARRDIDRIWIMDNVVIVTAVGVGMRHTPGVAGRIFSALGEAGINIIAIAQGSSEVSISLVVESADADESMIKIHNLIINVDEK